MKGPRMAIVPEHSGVVEGVVVSDEPDQRVDAFGGGSQGRLQVTMESGERVLDPGSIGPPGVERMEHHLGGRDQSGPLLVEGDLSSFGPGVLFGSPVVFAAHL